MDPNKIRFNRAFPGVFFLSLIEQKALEEFLFSNEHLLTDEQVLSIEKPGEGNMNCVVRVITNQRTFILKQSRPWVEKYPQIEAPIERLSVEGAYYQAIQESPLLTSMSPEMLWFDAKNHMMAMADLGPTADLSQIYKSAIEITIDQVIHLSSYLGDLHTRSAPEHFPDNLSMRQLNHEHIFNYPFRTANGLDLNQFTPGLHELAQSILADDALIQKINAIGEIYLEKGSHLIHGDFYPGSWLEIDGKIKVIDPEFGFVGPAEFDLGVMLAHLWMAQQPRRLISLISEKYLPWSDRNPSLIAAFAGIEILRRILGVAQLPLDITLAGKQDLLARASQWISGKDLPF